MARVLEVILTEVLVRLHVKGLGVHIDDKVDRVIVKLSSCVGCKELMTFRKAHVTDERVLELADDCVRLVVGHCRSEADCSVFKGHGEGEVHLQGLSSMDEVLICDGYHIALLGYRRCVFCAVDLHLLLVGSVVEYSPESCSRGIVVSCLSVGQGKKRSVFPYLHFGHVVAEDEAWNVG